MRRSLFKNNNNAEKVKVHFQTPGPSSNLEKPNIIFMHWPPFRVYFKVKTKKYTTKLLKHFPFKFKIGKYIENIFNSLIYSGIFFNIKKKNQYIVS